MENTMLKQQIESEDLQTQPQVESQVEIDPPKPIDTTIQRAMSLMLNISETKVADLASTTDGYKLYILGYRPSGIIPKGNVPEMLALTHEMPTLEGGIVRLGKHLYLVNWINKNNFTCHMMTMGG
jgi:hypothetical protein